MTVAALHQFVPTLERSAVGDHVLEVQQVLRGLGLESEIFAECQSPDFSVERLLKVEESVLARWPKGRQTGTR